MDRLNTYTLLDFISYLCEFGFINFFRPTFCVWRPHKNASSPVPYRQALNHAKAKTNETDDHLPYEFKKVTITIPLIDAINHIPSYAKFLKGICTPHRNPRKIQLSETVSSIMMNALPIKKRDPRALMITSEIGGMSFTRSLLDTGASIKILPKACRGVTAFLSRVMLIRWIGEETPWTSRRFHS